MNTENSQQESTNTTNGSATGAKGFGGVLQQLAASKGIAMSAMPQPQAHEGDGGSADSSADAAQQTNEPSETKPADAKQDDKAKDKQPDDGKSWADRYVKKDAQYQEQRRLVKQLEQEKAELEKKHNELIEALRNDYIGTARKLGVRFGDIAAAQLLADGKGKPKDGAQKPQDDDMPAWAKQLQETVNALKIENDELKREREERQQAQVREARVRGIADYLKDKSEYTVLNELGRHDAVLKLVENHLGDHGEVADERELFEIVETYAREVERQLREDLRGTFKRPGIKELVARELGLTPPRKEAKPARQEIEGEDDERGGAPVLSNDLTQQRVSPPNPGVFDKEAELRRTAAQMQAIFNRARGAR